MEARLPECRALDIVNSYYRACNQGGDLSEVPLADHVTFRGPLGCVEGADNFRAHTAARGDVTCSVREQFLSGNRVCSIADWQLGGPVSSLTTTEILEVRDGQIVTGEVIFDPEPIRTAIAQHRPTSYPTSKVRAGDVAGSVKLDIGASTLRKMVGIGSIHHFSLQTSHFSELVPQEFPIRITERPDGFPISSQCTSIKTTTAARETCACRRSVPLWPRK